MRSWPDERKLPGKCPETPGRPRSVNFMRKGCTLALQNEFVANLGGILLKFMPISSQEKGRNAARKSINELRIKVTRPFFHFLRRRYVEYSVRRQWRQLVAIQPSHAAGPRRSVNGTSLCPR